MKHPALGDLLKRIEAKNEKIQRLGANASTRDWEELHKYQRDLGKQVDQHPELSTLRDQMQEQIKLTVEAQQQIIRQAEESGQPLSESARAKMPDSRQMQGLQDALAQFASEGPGGQKGTEDNKKLSEAIEQISKQIAQLFQRHSGNAPGAAPG